MIKHAEIHLPICEVCELPKLCKGSIVGDNYYRHICHDCYADLTAIESPSSGQAEYNRGRDHEERLADIIQPFNGDGKPSAEFIHLYPEKAHQLMSDDEIDAATRS